MACFPLTILMRRRGARNVEARGSRRRGAHGGKSAPGNQHSLEMDTTALHTMSQRRGYAEEWVCLESGDRSATASGSQCLCLLGGDRLAIRSANPVPVDVTSGRDVQAVAAHKWQQTCARMAVLAQLMPKNPSSAPGQDGRDRPECCVDEVGSWERKERWQIGGYGEEIEEIEEIEEME
ncbi:unnamed protein product [Cutaneotrichosporon oleaginosum]